MRVAYEFKISPREIADWDSGLFDYACAYISELDKAEQERQNKMKSPTNAARTMRGGGR